MHQQFHDSFYAGRKCASTSSGLLAAIWRENDCHVNCASSFTWPALKGWTKVGWDGLHCVWVSWRFSKPTIRLVTQYWSSYGICQLLCFSISFCSSSSLVYIFLLFFQILFVWEFFFDLNGRVFFAWSWFPYVCSFKLLSLENAPIDSLKLIS